MAHLFKTVVDLNQKNREVIWDTLATVGDKNAHTFAIGLRSDNRSVDLANARVQLLVRRADKKDRIITGSVSDDNYAVATLDEYCYEITGRIRCTLLISVNGATLTGVRATLTVEDGLGDVIINPAGEIPNLPDLLAEIDGMRQATAAANTAAKNANDAAAMIEQIRADIESAVNEAKEAVEEAETAVSEATTAIKEAQKITTGWANAQTEAESVPSDSPAEVNMGLDDEGNRILIFKIPKGQNGLNPHIGANGHWFVGNVDTGIKAKGDTGDDGITPHIGANGNWFVGAADTGVRAQGPQGAPGTGSGTVTGVVLNGQTYVPNNLGVIELPELGGSDVELSDSIPSALGQNASAGTGSKAAREDHVHKMPSASDTGALGKNERAVDSAKLAGKEPSHYENKITSITANGQAVQPDENGTVNLGTIGRSNLEINDETPSETGVYSSKKVEDVASQLSQQIERLSERTSFITVGSKNCDFTTVVDAVAYAKTIASVNNRVCIVINSGIYVGSINLIGNCGIDLVAPAGAVIQGDKPYPEAAIFVGGHATFVNLTFKSTVPGTYACHIESLTDQSGGEQRFINCFFQGDMSAIGVGSGDGYSQRYENCEFYSLSTENAVYFHNNPHNVGTGYISFTNCVLHGNLFATEYEGNTSTLVFTFVGCSAKKVVYGKGSTEELVYASNFANAEKLILNSESACNSIPALNRKEIIGIAFTAHTLSNGLASVYIPELHKYDISVIRALQGDGSTPLTANYSASASYLAIVTEGYTGTIYVELNLIPK